MPACPLVEPTFPGDSCPGRNATGQQARPGGRANGGGGVHVGETNARFGNPVDRRGMQILGSVASGVHASLIIRIDQEDIGFGRPQKDRQAKDKEVKTIGGRAHEPKIKGADQSGNGKGSLPEGFRSGSLKTY